jgi:hypothetical protein
MSKASRVYVIVVLEDTRHEMLVRRYLIKRGLGKNEMRIERSPSGEGSAENWVRKAFVKEVSVYRSRHAKTKLIVVIDADTRTVQERLTQLNQALTDGAKPTVGDDEQIARLIPKRNVETWILCLNGQFVNEETDYKQKRDDWNDLVPQASETLSLWARPKAVLPNYCLDSLRRGVQELNSLNL